MKVGKYATLCALRRSFNTVGDLADVINRSKPYVVSRLKGTQQFTPREKRMILRSINQELTESNYIYYFGGPADEENRKQETDRIVTDAV